MITHERKSIKKQWKRTNKGMKESNHMEDLNTNGRTILTINSGKN
jgi:hypothetical protein